LPPAVRFIAMARKTAIAACLAALSVLAVEPAAAAHPARYRHNVVRQARHPAQRQGQIACTVLGCQRIPAACTPVEGRTPGGIPTGFDVIACPPGTWPLK
jgi:hypothetical protein